MAKGKYGAVQWAVICICFLAVTTAQQDADCPEWSFFGTTGPAYWGELCDAYTICGTGQNQAPLNYASRYSAVDPTLSAINFQYAPPSTSPTPTTDSSTMLAQRQSSASTLSWTGNVIDFAWSSTNQISGGPLAESTAYPLKQVRFHFPSVNHLEDLAYPLEIQLVHQNANGQYAALSILYDANDTASSSFLEALNTNLVGDTDVGVVVQTPDLISFTEQAFSLGYYTVEGSIPVPPCTEDVVWIMAVNVMQAPRSLLNTFGGVLARHARPVQPLNDRVIRIYHPPLDSNQVAGVIILLSMLLVVIVMAILFIIVVRYKMRMGLV